MSEKEINEKIRPYRKHNIYTSVYKVDEHGRVFPSEDSQWIVLSYEGATETMGFFSNKRGGEVIALVLNDPSKKFWPVISFLTKKEAVELARMILYIAGEDMESIEIV